MTAAEEAIPSATVFANGVINFQIETLARLMALGIDIEVIMGAMNATTARAFIQTSLEDPEWAAGWNVQFNEKWGALTAPLVATVLKHLPVPLTEQPKENEE